MPRKTPPLRIPDPLPDWLLNMHPQGHLDRADLIKLFGVCDSTLRAWVADGLFPPPDGTAKTLHSESPNACDLKFRQNPIIKGVGWKKLKWKAITVRSFLRVKAGAAV